jgi:transposase
MGRRKAPASGRSVTRPSFSNAFREDAVRRVLVSGRSVPVVAKELGIGDSTLYRWVAKLQGSLVREDDVEAVRRENRRLKEAVAFLQDENEILRKAALAYARNTAPAHILMGG